ncbi:MAG: RlmE family RNA methyltransferase [Deltaproteobacteria bacterium]|nr:MAG: RlmE family RNA methyltransferase [Deltaproteobacteria bacterium]UCF48973.1 MAG: RlmE family RNA methyltransferase [Myxococcales bacterium]
MAPRRKQDHHGRRARREGYPARSVYKLQEIDRRVGLFKKGQRVLDLGASPGSWTLYAAERVGPTGQVLGIDLNDPEVALPPQAEIRTLDAFEVDPGTLGGPFDLVISDMAPKTSGQRHADQFRSYELVMRALELTKMVLKPGGTFVAKIFQGAEFDDARNAIREAFGKVRIIRPKATRDESYEVFLVGLGFRPATS